MFARAAYLRNAFISSASSLNRSATRQLKIAKKDIWSRDMATASQIQLEAGQQPEFYVERIGEESARTASHLLQLNHEKHHIFFNQEGFHVCFNPLGFFQSLIEASTEPHRPPPSDYLRTQSHPRRNQERLRQQCHLPTSSRCPRKVDCR